MGLCISSVGVAVAEASPPRATALVLLPTGELREYPRPATAARALADAAGGEGWFLCDADTMGFEGPVSAVGGGEALRAGQIYFVLPAAARRRGLRREEVAALAVRTSAALAAKASSSGAAGRRRRGAVAPLVLSPPSEEKVLQNQAFHARKAAPSDGKRRRFASRLTAIPECETSE